MKGRHYWETKKELKEKEAEPTQKQASENKPDHESEISNFINGPKPKKDIENTEQEHPADLNETIKCINKKMKEIFENLNIKNLSEQDKAFALFSYVVKNSKYDNKIMKEKKDADASLEDEKIQAIYNCLIENKSNSIGDAGALNFLFDNAGIDSQHITLGPRGEVLNDLHDVVKFTLDNQECFCDPTLVRFASNDKQVKKSLFAFTPTYFFNEVYPNEEIKVEHQPLNWQHPNDKQENRLKSKSTPIQQ